ncbi:MAG TPA: flippase [Candidatus Polarisedimenticolia bacterium]|jgi:O-antigen/teichoic acid export membrane protein
MSAARGLLRNSAALAAGNFAASMLGLFFMAAFARSRGPEGLGAFQFAAAVASLTTLVVALGLDILLVREIARDRSRANPLAAASLAFKATLALPALGLIALIAEIRYGGPQGQVLLVVTAAALLDVMTATFTSVFRAFERMEYEAAVMIGGSVASAIAGASALAAGWDLVSVVSCWALGSVVKAAAAYAFARGRFVTGPLVSSRAAVASLAGPSLACGALAVIGAIYSNADIVMLQEMASQREVGWYTAATKLISVVLYVPSLLMASLFPLLSRQGSALDKTAAAASYDQAFYALLCMGLPAGVGAALVAGPFVRLVYGEGFEMSATALVLLSPYLGWFFINLVNGTAMMALGRQRFLAVGTGLATAFNVAGNYLAIPRFGMAGACFTTVVASGAGAVLYTIVCHRDLRLPFRWSLLLRAAASAAVMGASVSALSSFGLHVLLVIPAGAAIYVAGLRATGVLRFPAASGHRFPAAAGAPVSAEGSWTRT